MMVVRLLCLLTLSWSFCIVLAPQLGERDFFSFWHCSKIGILFMASYYQMSAKFVFTAHCFCSSFLLRIPMFRFFVWDESSAWVLNQLPGVQCCSLSSLLDFPFSRCCACSRGLLCLNSPYPFCDNLAPIVALNQFTLPSQWPPFVLVDQTDKSTSCWLIEGRGHVFCLSHIHQMPTGETMFTSGIDFMEKGENIVLFVRRWWT